MTVSNPGSFRERCNRAVEARRHRAPQADRSRATTDAACSCGAAQPASSERSSRTRATCSAGTMQNCAFLPFWMTISASPLFSKRMSTTVTPVGDAARISASARRASSGVATFDFVCRRLWRRGNRTTTLPPVLRPLLNGVARAGGSLWLLRGPAPRQGQLDLRH